MLTLIISINTYFNELFGLPKPVLGLFGDVLFPELL